MAGRALPQAFRQPLHALITAPARRLDPLTTPRCAASSFRPRIRVRIRAPSSGYETGSGTAGFGRPVSEGRSDDRIQTIESRLVEARCRSIVALSVASSAVQPHPETPAPRGGRISASRDGLSSPCARRMIRVDFAVGAVDESHTPLSLVLPRSLPCSAAPAQRTDPQGDLRRLRQRGMIMEGEAAEYVSRVGQRVAAASGWDKPFVFSLVDSGTVNAMALPDGYIFPSVDSSPVCRPRVSSPRSSATRSRMTRRHGYKGQNADRPRVSARRSSASSRGAVLRRGPRVFGSGEFRRP